MVEASKVLRTVVRTVLEFLVLLLPAARRGGGARATKDRVESASSPRAAVMKSPSNNE